MNKRSFRTLLVLLAATSLVQVTSAQSPAPQPARPPIKLDVAPQKPDAPVDAPETHASDEEVHAEMKKLIVEVELRLRDIDKLLAEAAAGDAAAAAAASRESGKAQSAISALVKRSQAQGQNVVQSIDKILELANHEHQGGGQCKNSGGLCKASSKSPGSKPGEGQQSSPQPGEKQGKNTPEGSRDTTTQREATPDKPGSELGDKPQGKKPGAGGDPKDNKKSDQEARNSNGKPPPGSDAEKVARSPDARDTWGYLPEHARDVFRTQGGGEMPARYREWIDAYYKKLNQKP